MIPYTTQSPIENTFFEKNWGPLDFTTSFNEEYKNPEFKIKALKEISKLKP